MRHLAKFAPLALVIGLAACGTTTSERASTGAIGGAVAGAVLGGDLAGAAVGGVAGAAIGAATLGDTYAVAYQLPAMIYFLTVGGGLNSVFVPQLVRSMKEDEDGGERRFDPAAHDEPVHVHRLLDVGDEPEPLARRERAAHREAPRERLARADRDVPAVGGLVHVVERRRELQDV